MVYINGTRNGYDEEQTGETMTVKELIEFLSQYEDEEKVYLMNDGGYTYGSITERDISTDKNDLGYRY
jgi:hypothetical protein